MFETKHAKVHAVLICFQVIEYIRNDKFFLQAECGFDAKGIANAIISTKNG
ncbi:MAG: hypothetical protein LBQ28_04050 [Prevotellaceae bacterium]|nr:hypothetical protein [Prevotellaceae bacterium]